LNCSHGLGTGISDIGAYGGGFVPYMPQIINVPDDYSTIQEAIDASFRGDSILVQPGTYIENINFNGHNVVLGSLFLTTEDSWYISATIVDGSSSGSTVSFENGESNTAAIIGFTIQNGYISDSGGGGIRCYYGSNPTISNNVISRNYTGLSGGGIACAYDSSPTISNNIITENISENYGGGITCYISSPLITDNIIDNNTAYGNTVGVGRGAGIYCGGNSSPTIINNTISNNTIDAGQNFAIGGGIGCYSGCNPLISNNVIIGNRCLTTVRLGFGGGIHSHSCNPIITSNIVSGNEADSAGGGIVVTVSGPATMVANNIISGNSVSGWGGGLACAYSPNFTIINNTVYGNTASRGAGFLCWETSPVITNTIFWANNASIEGDEIYIVNGSPTISYCDIQGGWQGIGNIDCDPMFCYPDTGNFYIDASSCCVGAGEGGADIGALGIGCDTRYKYLPGDCNMALGLWPPTVIGGDVTYLIDYFIGQGNAPCKLDDFWASADVTGDCMIIGGDVSVLVGYLIGTIPAISYCPDYEPAWLEGVPDDPPDGWPNCDAPAINSKIIPTGSVK